MPIMASIPRLRRGFTLIELLVVISIVGVLMSFLLPALQKSREQAKRVLCQSNLRSNGVAINAYAMDFRDWLPFPTMQSWLGPPVAMDAGLVYNQGLLYPYLNFDARTLFCPDVITARPNTWLGFVNPGLGARNFKTAYDGTRSRTVTSYGMPLRWQNPAAPPVSPSSPPWDIFDIRKSQNNTSRFIALLLTPNTKIASPHRRNYPVMGCLQEWGFGQNSNESYGAHAGLLSHMVYPDGVVRAIEYNFRANNSQLFRSAAPWDIFTTIH
jgi:prepilin-type N-terminal cleavage/methylation domain-containing protein